MSSPSPTKKLSAYSGALKAISVRTGTPLSSLVLSFGILHEVTAVAPLFIFFYGARTFGVGDKLIQTIAQDPSFNLEEESTPPKDLTQWGKQKLSRWVTEGDRWAARVGTRYGIFGYEKRKPGEKPDVEALTHKPGHLAGDVANAVVAYAVTKLKFKRTPEEEAEHQARKARRKEKKRKRAESDRYHNPHGPSSSKRAHKENADDDDVTWRKWASSDEDEERASKAEREHTRPSPGGDAASEAEMEFRQKMFDAMGEDDRLDGVETHLNDFVHIPDRWKRAATTTSESHLYDADDFLRLNPNALDDDEYAEWIRLGMYRKSHAAEHAEQVRRKAVAEERKAAEKARRAETRRLEKEAEEERRRKRRERETAKKVQAKDEYHAKWKILLEEANASEGSTRPLEFGEIPWPVYHAPGEDAFSKESISSFLLGGREGDRKERKEILRETLLRFHPDKFEGRFMRRVPGGDEERVREAIGQISRVLNDLLEDVQ
ncbi:hypothetical protein EST38_g10966 [Candolleomyces aberdarensis]|uniref:Uncharacterized protein n=1 Tax=Candolleomyces aberdarensis TaxID=2316362 RepID=A0A4Q2D631_9AGAR|nr:hypothetical protein EST38_g10966 [Candolleomyces aberdarensis]